MGVIKKKTKCDMIIDAWLQIIVFVFDQNEKKRILDFPVSKSGMRRAIFLLHN